MSKKSRTLFLACPICDEGTLHVSHVWMDEQDHLLKAGKAGLFLHHRPHEWYSLEETWELYCTKCNFVDKYATKDKLLEALKVMDSILLRQNKEYKAPEKPVSTTPPMKAILKRPSNDAKKRSRIYSFVS